MEFRTWHENGDLIGHCVIQQDEEGFDDVEIHPPGWEESYAKPAATRTLAIFVARALCEKWKTDAEEEYEKRFGEKPVGVEHPTGFFIEEVDD